MRMPHDHFADDLNWSAESGSEGGRMPSLAMGAQYDASLTS